MSRAQFETTPDVMNAKLERFAYGFRKVGQDPDKILLARPVEEPKALSQLFKFCDIIVEKYSGHIRKSQYSINESKRHPEIYSILFDCLYNEFFVQGAKSPPLNFTVDDLSSFIHTKQGAGSDKFEEIALGMYTGALLHLLTISNMREKKRTIVHLSDVDMNCLFYCARRAGTVILENCKGNHVLKYAGARTGTIGKIVVNNFTGSQLAESAGSNEGRIGMLILNNIISESMPPALRTLSALREDGAVANNFCYTEGKAGLFIARNIKCRTFAHDIASRNGSMNMVVADSVITNLSNNYRLKYTPNSYDVDGDIEPPYFMLSSYLEEKQGFNLVVVNNVSSYALNPVERSAKWVDSCDNNLVDRVGNPEEYARVVKKFKINKMLGLVDNLAGKTTEEQTRMIDQIYAIYKANAARERWK